MALFRRQHLADPNCDLAAVTASHEWRTWPSPLNAVGGEHHYQKQIHRALGAGLVPNGHLEVVAVTLERDAANEYDSNAVRAVVNGEHVGHLRRPIAAQLGPAMDRSKVRAGQVVGLARGGASNSGVDLIGIHVWLDRLLAPLPAVTLQVTPDLLVSWPPFAREGKPTDWEQVACIKCGDRMVREGKLGEYECECGAVFTL